MPAPAEYAQANRVSHPKNVYLKEADVLGHVDDWLAELFDADGIEATVAQLTEQAERLEDPAAQARAEAAQARITEYDAQISRYRASIDAGGDPAVIGPRIAETQVKKVTAQAEVRTATGRRSMSRDEIEAVVAAFGDLSRVVQGAEPADKADIYAKLRLTLTYEPKEREVKAIMKPGLDMRKGFVFEDRHAPYVHDRHRADHGVRDYCWRCALTGQICRSLLWRSGCSALASRRPWRRTLPMASGMALPVRLWPRGPRSRSSCELLMMIIRSTPVPADVTAVAGLSGRPPDADPLQVQAAQLFADDLAAGRVPSVRAIRTRLHVGQPRAQRAQAYLASLTAG
jgi:hypothetical protein